jgi:DNA ligase-1
VSSEKGTVLFSRTGDDISHSFPDLLKNINFNAVLDGELLVKKDNEICSFNNLQQRLNKNKPSAKLMIDNPAYLVVYDILEKDGEELQSKTLDERHNVLNDWLKKSPHPLIELSKRLEFNTLDDLIILRENAEISGGTYIEGLMLKKRDSKYISGRPIGKWYKWKRNPMLIDAILMYAQRGGGKRSSFYSDYTFGLWTDEGQKEILPIGKAYSGFTDEELKKLDQFLRNNTLHRYGPVREVKKELVFEVAFDSVNISKRHKSGYALRFPRINRIRWDKPASEADILENLEKLVLS